MGILQYNTWNKEKKYQNDEVTTDKDLMTSSLEIETLSSRIWKKYSRKIKKISGECVGIWQYNTGNKGKMI